MLYYQTNNLIKVRFPTPFTENHWAVEEKSAKTTFAVPYLAVLLIIACTNPITKEELFDFFDKRKINDNYKIDKTLKNLISRNIVNTISLIKTDENYPFDKWKNAGWESAAHYHFFTWDAPFLDYSKEGGGHDLDRKNMLQYQAERPDIQRFKSYTNALSRIDLSLRFQNPITIQDKVKLILGIAFGKKGEKTCHWSTTPLIRRTSPSGGSRHPTEGYFLSHLKGIPLGWHHIQREPPSLVHFSTCANSDFLEFVDTKTVGYIVLTSIFERNMYRYREPRTFRTVHMDSGHILETIEQLAKKNNLSTQIHLDFDENYILKMIKSSKFEEGVMAVISFKQE